VALAAGLLRSLWLVMESVLAAVFATTTGVGMIVAGIGLILTELTGAAPLVQIGIVALAFVGVPAEVVFLTRLWRCFQSRLFPLPLAVGLHLPYWRWWIRALLGVWWFVRFAAGFWGVVVLNADTVTTSTEESMTLFLLGTGWMHMALGYLLAAVGAFGLSQDRVGWIWRKRFWLDVAAGAVVVALGTMLNV